MEVIILGVFNETDKLFLDSYKDDKIRIIWDYNPKLIDCYEGIKKLKKYYKFNSMFSPWPIGLFAIGLLIDEKDYLNEEITSYELLNEITNTYINNDIKTDIRLFRFFDYLVNSQIKEMIIAFANQWDNTTLIRKKTINFSELKKELDVSQTWRFDLYIVKSGYYIEEDEYPLLLELVRT